jgi:hypothetical protein
MKRILLSIFILIAFCLGAVYILVPSEIKISNIALAPCIPKNTTDCLQDQSTWKRWWPKYAAKDYDYKLTNPFTDGAEIQLSKGEKKLKTRILVIPSGKDSSAVEWQTSFTSSYNPFKRVAQWFEAKEIKSNMHSVMDSLLNFATKTENIYGFHIERTTFTDTILAVTKFLTNTYPSTEIIYDAVTQLKEKIRDEGAEEKDFPMLNVRETDDNQFEAMIAICINKEIKNEANIFTTRMVPMKDRFLKTEVIGGPLSIKNAHRAIEKYMNDHLLSAPAIPFEILITDRSKETDSSKWKTKIFHPSM